MRPHLICNYFRRPTSYACVNKFDCNHRKESFVRWNKNKFGCDHRKESFVRPIKINSIVIIEKRAFSINKNKFECDHRKESFVQPIKISEV